ncbi:aminotransferase class V-fold PLP-dependent enzyme [Rossellomorea arthrocnemi]
MSYLYDAYRKEFPILQQYSQLSSCSQSSLHQDVKASVTEYMNSWELSGMDWDMWMTACEEARSQFAQLINAEPCEVAIVSSVSHAVSAIATSLKPQAQKNEILVTDFDFPTVGHVWLSHQERFQINYLEANEDGTISLEDYEKTISDQTLLVSTSHISYYNGFKQNLSELSKIVHGNGSLLFVDAYQSAGQTPIDVKAMDIDMLSTGLQKYMLGIPGIAFLYIRKELAETLTPSITGWFGQNNPFAFDIRNSTYAGGARRFDSGTFPMINGFAAKAALNILLQLNMKEVENYLQSLSEVAIQSAKEAGLTLKSPLDVTRKGSNTALFIPNAGQAEKRMKEHGYIVSARNDVIRIAPHFYNTAAEVKNAIYALAEVHAQLKVN